MKIIIAIALIASGSAVIGFTLGKVKKQREMGEVMIPMLETALKKADIEKAQQQQALLTTRYDNHCNACRKGVFSLWPNGESYCTFCGAKNHYPELVIENIQQEKQ